MIRIGIENERSQDKIKVSGMVRGFAGQSTERFIDLYSLAELRKTGLILIGFTTLPFDISRYKNSVFIYPINKYPLVN